MSYWVKDIGASVGIRDATYSAGFSGYVPRELQAKYPQAKISMKRKWCGFDGTAQLDPTDPLFHEMGLAFLEEQDKLFGSYGVYAADPFTRALLR